MKKGSFFILQAMFLLSQYEQYRPVHSYVHIMETACSREQCHSGHTHNSPDAISALGVKQLKSVNEMNPA
jgi:hypothetical protein